MKKFLTVSVLLTAAITATAQVSLQPVVPAVGMIQKTQLWNVLIANSSSEPYNCRLELVLKDRSSNLEVFTATTSVFALGAGAKQFNINSLGPVQYNYLSPGFDAKQTGLLPVGNYTACYSLTGTGEKAISLADECIQFDIEPLSPPMLISPADSSLLETAPAQFSWIPPAPDGMFSRLNYEIIITPVNEGQTATEAIQENVPFYSQGNLTANFLSYAAAYQAFEKDKWYAWQVVARDDRNYAGKKDAWVFKMNADGTKVIGEGKHVYDGHDQDHTVEGPKFFKRNGYYYLFPPAGGVATGWQLALRSKNIYGPYERKVVMDQGSTTINGPHQGAMVQTQTGEYWFFHFQDKGTYGRVVHLQPVQWKNDWPVIGVDKDGDGKGEPVITFKKPNVRKTHSILTPAESDEFNSDTLGLQWQWHANPKIQWWALMRNAGYLRLFAYPSDSGKNFWTVPNLLLQKFPAADFTATAKIKWTVEWDVWQKKKAGLIIMGNDYAYLSIIKNEKGFFVSLVNCKDALLGKEEEIIEQQPLRDSIAYLRINILSPDATCSFSYSEDGVNYKSIGKSFIAKPDKWIGAKVGLFCTGTPGVRNGGYADVDWFRITK